MLSSILSFALIFGFKVSRSEYGCSVGMDRLIEGSTIGTIYDINLEDGYELTVEGCSRSGGETASSYSADIWLKLYDATNTLVESCDDCEQRISDCDSSYNIYGDLGALTGFGIYKLKVDSYSASTGGTYKIELFCNELPHLSCFEEGAANTGISGETRIQIPNSEQVDSGREHIYYYLEQNILPFERTYTVTKTGNIRMTKYYHSNKYRDYHVDQLEDGNGEISWITGRNSAQHSRYIQVAGPPAANSGTYQEEQYTIKCTYVENGGSAALSVPMHIIEGGNGVYMISFESGSLFLFVILLIGLLLTINIVLICMGYTNCPCSSRKRYKTVSQFSDTDIESQQLK